MRTQMFGIVVASFAATALASTQPPAQGGQQPQQPGGTAPAYQQQVVTVEGCLRREGAADEAALELATDPDSNVVFVVVNTEVRSRIDTMPGEAGVGVDGRVLGPADLQNERAGVPVEEPAESEPARAGERPASPAIAGAPTPAADNYVVVGLDNDRLKALAGQRVAMTGQFEPPVAAVKDVGERAAQDPGARADQARPTGEIAAPTGTSGVERRPINLPRFRATSIKPVPGICPPKP